MKKLLFLYGVISIQGIQAQKQDPELWYRQPASVWTEALPIGNGRMGAMVFGNPNNEILQLNEESVWAGSKFNNNNPGAQSHLKEIQEMIFRGDYAKAMEWSNKYLVGTPPRVRSYQPLGNLHIQFDWKGKVENYRRSLNLATGITTTSYVMNGNRVTQEVYASALQDVIVVKIQAGSGFDANISLSRNFDAENENRVRRRRIQPSQPIYENRYGETKEYAYYSGQIIDTLAPFQGPPGKHMRYAAAMKVLSTNGRYTTLVSDSSVRYHFTGAKDIVLLITGSTNYHFDHLDIDENIDALAKCKELLAKAAKLDENMIQKEHVKEHRNLFERVSLSLGPDELSGMATDERLQRIKEGKTDNYLDMLYYQMARYLLMGSSRKPGRLPANLQGIWNDLYDAPWNADFHTNINLQMNYWPAESGGLGETATVLSQFVQNLTVPGTVTAREMYGAKGWTIHHLTDPFGKTGVMDGVWGITSMDGAWMTFPVFEHFAYTLDTNFLRQTAYPIIKGAVEFVLDFLITSPEGYLVTNPSHSPENAFYAPGTNKKVKSQMTYAPTVDTHIINELFHNFLQSAAILKRDPLLVDIVKTAQKKLPPLKVAANGTLQEWIEDYEEVDPGHRHMSHLLGLYPLHLITDKDSVFYEASRKTIARRLANGGGHVGWSKAWIVGLYARLKEAEKAKENLNDLLRKSTLPNLFDNYPPFQIDANFGGAAAIIEMLVQSQGEEILLLPALPAVWSEGSLQGIRQPNTASLNIDWKNGHLTKVSLHSIKGGNYTLRYGTQKIHLQLTAGEWVQLNSDLIKM